MTADWDWIINHYQTNKDADFTGTLLEKLERHETGGDPKPVDSADYSK